jgi:hypothetical protein
VILLLLLLLAWLLFLALRVQMPYGCMHAPEQNGLRLLSNVRGSEARCPGLAGCALGRLRGQRRCKPL